MEGTISKTVKHKGGFRSYTVTARAEGLLDFKRSGRVMGKVTKQPSGGYRIRLGTSGAQWLADAATLDELLELCIRFVEFREVWDDFDFAPTISGNIVSASWRGMNDRWKFTNSIRVPSQRYEGLDRDLAIEQAKRDHGAYKAQLVAENESLLLRFRKA